MKKYIFDICPIGKPRMTQSDKWKKRAATTQYWQFKDDLVKYSLIHKFKIPVKDILEIKFFLPMPKSWSKNKKAEMRNQSHQQKPDLDNLLKAFLDALLPDDSVIWSCIISKHWADKGSIEITDHKKED